MSRRARGLGRLRLASSVPSMGAIIRTRLRQLEAALEPTAPVAGDIVSRAKNLLASGTDAEIWLSLAVLSGELPESTDVLRCRRVLELDGPKAAFAEVFALARGLTRAGSRSATIEIVTDDVLVDVVGLIPGDAAEDGRDSAVAMVQHWARRPGVRFVTWAGARGLRDLSADEAAALSIPVRQDARSGTILVPWRTTYLLAGTVDLPISAERVIALGTHSGTGGGAIGFGLAPLVDAEHHPTRRGPHRYAWHLAAERSLPALVAMTRNAEIEYAGWERMLSAIGIAGPRIVAVHSIDDGRERAGNSSAAAADEAWQSLMRYPRR